MRWRKDAPKQRSVRVSAHEAPARRRTTSLGRVLNGCFGRISARGRLFCVDRVGYRRRPDRVSVRKEVVGVSFSASGRSRYSRSPVPRQSVALPVLALVVVILPLHDSSSSWERAKLK